MITYNFFNKYTKGWATLVNKFNEDETIKGFKMIDGQLGFSVSGKDNEGVFLKAEGFKEFLEAQTQKNIKPTKAGIITSESLPGLEIWNIELGPNTQQEAIDKMKRNVNK